MTGAAVSAALFAALAGWLLPSGGGGAVRWAGRRAAQGLWAARVARVVRVVLVGARAREAERLQAELDELLDGLAAEVGAGAASRTALAAAAEGLARLESVRVAASAPGGDVVRSLGAVAARPGGEAAGDLALVWRVAESTGCGLSNPVGRLLASRRAQQQARAELQAQLAGPRATMRLLAGLPVAGLAMGSALGVEPVGFLTSTGPGRACLVAGVFLLGLGWWWSRTIVGAAQRPSATGR